MVVGYEMKEDDKLSLALDDGCIEWVSEFPYLRSLIAESGRTHLKVDKRITNASKAFGALRRAVFKDAHLSVATKRSVYRGRSKGDVQGVRTPPPPPSFDKILFICNTNCSRVSGWTPPPPFYLRKFRRTSPPF